MAARKKPQVKKNPKLGPTALQGKALLQASYGNQTNLGGVASTGTKAVMDYYNALDPKARRLAYRDIANKANARTNGLTGVLYGDLPLQARLDYGKARGMYSGGGAATAEDAAGTKAAFASGVSASSLQFVKELSQSRLAEGESEAGKAGPTKNKKRKKQTGKLVRRAGKKTGIKPKKFRKAIRTEGVSKQERKLYAQAPKKLSSRLRMADRRNDRKGK